MGSETPVQAGKRVLALVAKHEPKAEVRVGAAYDHRTHTRFARNEITTSGDGDDWSLSITVQLGLRSATVTTNQLDSASLDKLVQRTIANAKISPELPETMPVLGAAKPPPNALHDPALASLDARARAQGIAAALEPSRSADLQTAGYVEVHDGVIARISSAGLEVSAPYTDSSFSVTARTKDVQDPAGTRWARANEQSSTSQRSGESPLRRPWRPPSRRRSSPGATPWCSRLPLPPTCCGT